MPHRRGPIAGSLPARFWAYRQLGAAQSSNRTENTEIKSPVNVRITT